MSEMSDKRNAAAPEKSDPPGKPFRTPNKNKTHPAPETATDGHPVEKDKEQKEQKET